MVPPEREREARVGADTWVGEHGGAAGTGGREVGRRRAGGGGVEMAPKVARSVELGSVGETAPTPLAPVAKSVPMSPG
jgi:hypothetical protein